MKSRLNDMNPAPDVSSLVNVDSPQLDDVAHFRQFLLDLMAAQAPRRRSAMINSLMITARRYHWTRRPGLTMCCVGSQSGPKPICPICCLGT